MSDLGPIAALFFCRSMHHRLIFKIIAVFCLLVDRRLFRLVATVVDTGSGRSSGRLCQRASSKRIPSRRWLVLLFVILLGAIRG
jgi:hypothetical protein